MIAMTSYHKPTTWAGVIEVVSTGHNFDCRPLRLKGESIYILSARSTDTALYGYRDSFNQEIVDSARELEARYLGEFDRVTAQQDHDVTYYVARDGIALIRVRRNGAVEVNTEALRNGNKRYADVVSKLEPVLTDLFTRKPDHWLLGTTV
jgi:hypothetical protein